MSATDIMPESKSLWVKNRNGGVVCMTTNARATYSDWARTVNRKGGDGYIIRRTKQEAEKDPTP